MVPIIKKLIQFLLAPLLILGLAFFISKKMISSKKTRPPVPREVVSTRVDVMQSAPQEVSPIIETFGNTQAYLDTTLSSQVSGDILRIAPEFEVGKSVSKGDWLVEINPADHLATLSARKSTLAAAKQALAEEETRSRLAAEDWINSGRDIATASDFTLRKPQLAAARANVEASQAAVEKAELDLERTTLRAPFDAIIQARSASPGNVVMMGTNLGSLLARERIQVRLPITPTQAEQLSLPRFGSTPITLKAELTTPTLPGVTWTASISRVEPSVDPKNQTLYLLGDIEAPFENSRTFLPIGAFVNATLKGNTLESVHSFPEVAVVEDAFVWIVTTDNTLAKQPVEIVFTQNSTILTRIPEPIQPMPLTVVRRPLASFKTGQPVIAATPESP